MTIRIEADSIAFTDDGHAWLASSMVPYSCTGCDRVLLDRHGCPGRTLGVAHITKPLDRPCDTCDGREHVSFGHGMLQLECFDRCIDGRHTFEIEWHCDRCEDTGVEPGYSCAVCERCIDQPTQLLLVSMVPGMALPVFEQSRCADTPAHVCQNDTRSHTGWLLHRRLPPPSKHEHTEGYPPMPPATKPGMWAVQLRVSQKTEHPRNTHGKLLR